MKLFLLIMITFSLYAKEFTINDIMMEKNVSSQYSKFVDISTQQYIFVTWDKETTRLANQFFVKNQNRLKKAVVLVDVSQTPKGIMSLFVLPRMRGYQHQIYLSYDDIYNKMIPYKPNHITIIKLDKKKIVSIEFFDTIISINNYFKRLM